MKEYKSKEIIKFISKNVEDTINLAKEFSKKLNENDIVILEGNLGAGKTLFVRGIAEYFNIKEDIVSPTFLIVNSYQINKNNKKLNLNHFDLYRINSFDELFYIGIDEYLENKGNINLFEWGLKFIYDFIEYRINNLYVIKINIFSEEEREINIEEVEK